MSYTSTYPPLFSSTLTYANRYDLDKINVFIEGDSTNPMYFSIDGISRAFPFGKHYFNISILDSINQEHKLKEGSRILFEVKSINDVVLRSDVAEINQRNGVITAFFDVLEDPLRTFKEIQDGQGTLTVAGVLEDKSTTENSIPKQFEGVTNYRCIFPIMIGKNLLNADSPITTNVEHKKSTLKGQFSFTKANISPVKTSTQGLTYDTNGAPNDKLQPEPEQTEGLTH